MNAKRTEGIHLDDGCRAEHSPGLPTCVMRPVNPPGDADAMRWDAAASVHSAPEELTGLVHEHNLAAFCSCGWEFIGPSTNPTSESRAWAAFKALSKHVRETGHGGTW